MSKNFIDPEFGELIAIGEVEALTGISKATIRNWRKPEHQHLAKFDYYSNGGRDVFYRRADIDAYLAEYGVQVGQSGFKRVEMPNSVKAPMLVPEFVGASRDAVLVVSKVTTENVYHWLEDQIAKQGIKFTDQSWKPYWLVFDDLDGVLPYITYHQRWTHHEWFRRAVLVARTYLADQQGLAISPVEILKLDVGAVPPLNEKK